MRQTCKYNPERDISQVDQFGFVNITKAIQNGYIPGNNESVLLDDDPCDDPSKIMGKPSDVFEAMRMQDTLISGIKEVYNKSEGSSYNKDEK